jgi:hypothetical protein
MNQAIFEKIVVNADGGIEPTYSEAAGLLVNPKLQSALKAAESACVDEIVSIAATSPTLSEIAMTAADKPQTAKKPAADSGNGLVRAVRHLQYFFGDGLRNDVLVRVKGLACFAAQTMRPRSPRSLGPSRYKSAAGTLA